MDPWRKLLEAIHLPLHTSHCCTQACDVISLCGWAYIHTCPGVLVHSHFSPPGTVWTDTSIFIPTLPFIRALVCNSVTFLCVFFLLAVAALLNLWRRYFLPCLACSASSLIDAHIARLRKSESLSFLFSESGSSVSCNPSFYTFPPLILR
jgi:hypothetical protein